MSKETSTRLYHSPQVKTKPRCPLLILITFLISTVKTILIIFILSRWINFPRLYNALTVLSSFLPFISSPHLISTFHFSPPLFFYIYIQNLCIYSSYTRRSEIDLRFGYGFSLHAGKFLLFPVAGEIFRRR